LGKGDRRAGKGDAVDFLEGLMMEDKRKGGVKAEVSARNLLVAIFDRVVACECANAKSSCATAAPAEWPVKRRVSGSSVWGVDFRMARAADSSMRLATSRKPRWQRVCSPS